MFTSSCNIINSNICCQKLEYLDIGWCVLVNIAAFDSMPFKHSLVTLNMDYTHIDEQCLKIITQNAPNLRHLSLKRSDGVYEITDVGLSYVGTHCTKLETLNIDRYAKATGRNLTNVDQAVLERHAIKSRNINQDAPSNI
jgi:hypothetical protein